MECKFCPRSGQKRRNELLLDNKKIPPIQRIVQKVDVRVDELKDEVFEDERIIHACVVAVIFSYNDLARDVDIELI
jgi:hypothetical protein